MSAMNELQAFLAEANEQVADLGVLTEDVVLGNAKYQGIFGDAVMMPVMTKTGYQDYLVTPVKVSRAQFSAAPAAHQSLVRTSTGRTMFVQIVDPSNPVVYTLVCTDRDL